VRETNSEFGIIEAGAQLQCETDGKAKGGRGHRRRIH
jgi:hypothetical protein